MRAPPRSRLTAAALALPPSPPLLRPLSLALALALSLPLSVALAPAPARAAGEFKVHGFPLPTGAVRVDDDRFRLPLSWEDTLRFYRNLYPPAKYPRRTLPNQNGVRALHLANVRATDEWEGVNLYESGRGEVRIFVLVRRGAQQP
jgi:hypothetical protein